MYGNEGTFGIIIYYIDIWKTPIGSNNQTNDGSLFNTDSIQQIQLD